MRRIRVLMVEDDEEDVILVRALLSGLHGLSYEVDWEPRADAALAALQRRTHDACLLDYRLGGEDGLEILRAARESGCMVPIIVLTGYGEGEVDETALAADADDFLSKAGISAAAIDRALRYAIRQRATLEELRESERERRRLSAELLAAQETERRSVARDIHDGIGQILAAAKFVLESTLVQGAGSCGDDMRAVIGRVVGMLGDVITEASRLQSGLRPTMLDSAGIGPTLSWFCDEFMKSYASIRVRTRIEIDEEEVPDTLKATLFRITQEAMNNVARHGRASEASVSLAIHEGTIRLEIEDNGSGFDGSFHSRPAAGGSPTCGNGPCCRAGPSPYARRRAGERGSASPGLSPKSRPSRRGGAPSRSGSARRGSAARASRECAPCGCRSSRG